MTQFSHISPEFGALQASPPLALFDENARYNVVWIDHPILLSELDTENMQKLCPNGRFSIGFTTPCSVIMRYLHSELVIPVSLSWCRCCNLCENGWRGPRLRFRQGIPSKLCATQGEMCPINPRGSTRCSICSAYMCILYYIYTYYEH